MPRRLRPITAILTTHDVVVQNEAGPRWGALAEKALTLRGTEWAATDAVTLPLSVENQTAAG